MPTYLITGASGFLGRHLITTLRDLEPKTRVVALARNPDNLTRQAWFAALGSIDVLEGDLAALPTLADDPLLAGLSGIFHAAAEVHHGRDQIEHQRRMNIDGTASVMALAAASKARVIFVSTSGASGCSRDPNAAPNEEAPTCDAVVSDWPYYASKIEAEQRARHLANQHDIPLSIVRPPVMIGPGDHRFRSTGHIIKMLRGRLPFLIEGGISFVDIRDVAAAMVRLMALPNMRPIYHLPGTACGVEAFFRRVGQVAGVSAPSIVLPYPAAHTLARLSKWTANRLGAAKPPLPDPVVVEMARHYWGLSSLYADKDLDFRPRDPMQTLADTVSWLRANHPDLSAR